MRLIHHEKSTSHNTSLKGLALRATAKNDVDEEKRMELWSKASDDCKNFEIF